MLMQESPVSPPALFLTLFLFVSMLGGAWPRPPHVFLDAVVAWHWPPCEPDRKLATAVLTGGAGFRIPDIQGTGADVGEEG